jgi:hypothetical protein
MSLWGYGIPLLAGNDAIVRRYLSAVRWPIPVVIETLIQHEVPTLACPREEGLHGNSARLMKT